MAKENEETIELGEKEKLTEILSECYEVAELESKKDDIGDLITAIGEEDSKVIIELANIKHACRGAAITLAIYKILHPEQDIRSHKVEYENGFSARGVSEAIQKVQTESVERYFILSTAKPDSNEWDEVQKLISDFRKSNGCEIIVNGVYETIKYYLRLLKSTNEFVNAYTELLAIDEDINYEHKVAWNAICAERE